MINSQGKKSSLATFSKVLLASAGCVAMLAGGAYAADGSLTILSSWSSGSATGDQFAKNIAAFEAATGISVDVQEVNNDDVDKVFEASALAGEEPDIVVLNLTPSSADWLPDGLVADVGQYLEDWGFKDNIQPGAIDYWDNDNGMNGFPYIGFNWPIWYNMDLFAKAGISEVPATFEELVADAKALRAAGIQPFAIGGKGWTMQNFITWAGQQYLSPEKAVDIFTNGGWCDADAVRGLDLIATMRDEGVFVDNVAGYDPDNMTNAYYTGAAAMMPSGSWAYTGAPADIAAATEVAGFPVPEGGYYPHPTAFNGHSAGFFVTRAGAENIEPVKQLLQYMYSPEVLRGWVGEANQILDATSNATAGAKSDAVLVVKGNTLTDANTSFMVLPDAYLPDNTDWGPTIGSEFVGTMGMTGAEVCKKLEQEYQY